AQHVYRLMAQIEGETVHDDVISGLDYDAVNKVLADNVPANADVNIEKHRLGNVLLTGASGFLGLHVLMELLKDSECYDKVYCLIRPTKRLNPEKRLKSILFFFENQDFDELIGNRVFAVGGDISKEEIFDEPNDIAFDTIINCAADVSHYAYGDKLDKANTKSVNNLMKLAKRFGAELVQVSTISVGGCYDTSKEKLTLPENALYIGQEIHNQYALSKYMAEYNALKAMADGVCNVKIMRVGNLQGRLSDGEFQIKKNTNAFTRQIVAYVRLGMVPESLYNSTVNFSPVDEVARMIVNLSMLPSNYTVFHVSPEEEVPFKMLFDAAVSLGYDVKVVSDQAFEEAIKELKKNKEIRSFLEAIFAERMDFKYSYSDISLDFTSDIIKKTGLKWGEIKKEYIDTYMRVLDEFGVFGGDK
ncbi:MAG: SDR family oxidoreductase, partial [Lachnospiraceae bacterium]|nr:SDR family oxidoreductase [Lachnospiraceae bacterium]